MEYAPIVLFTYNRPTTTEDTIKALLKNRECKNSVLYIFSDAPKNDKQIGNVMAVRDVIENIDRSKFKNVVVTYQTENQGLAKSIINGVSAVFKSFDRVIVLEDDCEVSPYFLNYMNIALEKYQGYDNIGAITGYSPVLKNLPDEDVYAVMRSCSLGWGTWKKVWQNVDFSMPHFIEWRKDWSFIRKMNSCGNDRMYRLIRQMKYNLQSWSIRFGAYMAANKLLTVYPKYSYIMNTGLESGGVHSSTDTPQAMKTGNNHSIITPVFPDVLHINKNIEKEFCEIYAGSKLSQLKRTVYVYGGERIIDAIRRKKG